MWNAISTLVQNYLDQKTATEKFGLRLAIFAVAVALHEGLSGMTCAIDELTNAVDRHRVVP